MIHMGVGKQHGMDLFGIEREGTIALVSLGAMPLKKSAL
jgi:hypothetical protein